MAGNANSCYDQLVYMMQNTSGTSPVFHGYPVGPTPMGTVYYNLPPPHVSHRYQPPNQVYSRTVTSPSGHPGNQQRYIMPQGMMQAQHYPVPMPQPGPMVNMPFPRPSNVFNHVPNSLPIPSVQQPSTPTAVPSTASISGLTRSSPPVSNGPTSTLPPRLKLLESLYKPSAHGQTESFIKAASSHGLQITLPLTKPEPSNQPVVKNNVASSIPVKTEHAIDLPNKPPISTIASKYSGNYLKNFNQKNKLSDTNIGTVDQANTKLYTWGNQNESTDTVVALLQPNSSDNIDCASQSGSQDESIEIIEEHEYCSGRDCLTLVASDDTDTDDTACDEMIDSVPEEDKSVTILGSTAIIETCNFDELSMKIVKMAIANCILEYFGYHGSKCVFPEDTSETNENTADIKPGDSFVDHTNEKNVVILEDINKLHLKTTQGIYYISDNLDSDTCSGDGSVSDSLDAFKLNAMRRGVKIEDPNDLLSDSDSEMMGNLSCKLFRRHSGPAITSEGSSTPTSDSQAHEQSIFQFAPAVTHSWSDSLNNSFAGSDVSDKLNSSQIRADAPEFVPRKKFKADAATDFKDNVLHINSSHDKKLKASVGTQVVPDCKSVSTGTKVRKMKEVCIETGSCDTRSVLVNTEESSAVAGFKVIKPSVRFVSKAIGTERQKQRTVGVNVRMRGRLKHDKDTMTEACLPQQVPDPLMKVVSLQREVLTFKVKQVMEKLENMKEGLVKNLQEVKELFSDRMEFDVVGGILQKKLVTIDTVIQQIQDEASSCMNLLEAGHMLSELPDFEAAVSDMSLHPTKGATSSQPSFTAPVASSSPKAARTSGYFVTQSGTSCITQPATEPPILALPSLSEISKVSPAAAGSLQIPDTDVKSLTTDVSSITAVVDGARDLVCRGIKRWPSATVLSKHPNSKCLISREQLVETLSELTEMISDGSKPEGSPGADQQPVLGTVMNKPRPGSSNTNNNNSATEAGATSQDHDIESNKNNLYTIIDNFKRVVAICDNEEQRSKEKESRVQAIQAHFATWLELLRSDEQDVESEQECIVSTKAEAEADIVPQGHIELSPGSDIERAVSRQISEETDISLVTEQLTVTQGQVTGLKKVHVISDTECEITKCERNKEEKGIDSSDVIFQEIRIEENSQDGYNEIDQSRNNNEKFVKEQKLTNSNIQRQIEESSCDKKSAVFSEEATSIGTAEAGSLSVGLESDLKKKFEELKENIDNVMQFMTKSMGAEYDVIDEISKYKPKSSRGFMKIVDNIDEDEFNDVKVLPALNNIEITCGKENGKEAESKKHANDTGSTLNGHGQVMASSEVHVWPENSYLNSKWSPNEDEFNDIKETSALNMVEITSVRDKVAESKNEMSGKDAGYVGSTRTVNGHGQVIESSEVYVSPETSYLSSRWSTKAPNTSTDPSQAPVSYTDTPVCDTCEPVPGACTPIAGTSTPVSGTCAPVSGACTPFYGTFTRMVGPGIQVNGAFNPYLPAVKPVLPNVDQMLYHSVCQQLLQAYPELSARPEMLMNLALQQTSLLQMHLQQGGGGLHPAGVFPQQGPFPYFSGGEPSFQSVNTGENIKPQIGVENIDPEPADVAPSCKEEEAGFIKAPPGLGIDARERVRVPEVESTTAVARLSTETDARNTSSLEVSETCLRHEARLKHKELRADLQNTDDSGLKPLRRPGLNQNISNNNNSDINTSVSSVSQCNVSSGAAGEDVELSSLSDTAQENKCITKFFTISSDPIASEPTTTGMTKSEENRSNNAVVGRDNQSSVTNSIWLTDAPALSNVADASFKATTTVTTPPKQACLGTQSRTNNCNQEEWPSLSAAAVNKATNQQQKVDFMPDYAKRHQQENKQTSVVNHIVFGVSDQVARSVASLDHIGLLLKPPTPPACVTSDMFKVKRQEDGVRTQKTAPRSRSRRQSSHDRSSTFQPTGKPRNRSRSQSQSSRPTTPSPLTTASTPKPSMSNFSITGENWDNEVDDYALPFTLIPNPKRPISSQTSMAMTTSATTNKNKTADLTNPLLTQVVKSIPVLKGISVTGLCEIELPEKSSEQKENQQPQDEWCEVQSKRRRHCSREQQGDRGKTAPAPYTDTAQLAANKEKKKSNFERLIGRMHEAFPYVDRKELIDAVTKIREARGSLSGLSMESIIEQAQGHISVRPTDSRKIPGLWTNTKKPQMLNLPPRLQSVMSQNCRLSCNEHLQQKAPIPSFNPSGPTKCEGAGSPEEEICVICHDGISLEPVKELDCKHVFHSQCIGWWVERERSCPTCRKLALFPEEFPRLGK